MINNDQHRVFCDDFMDIPMNIQWRCHEMGKIRFTQKKEGGLWVPGNLVKVISTYIKFLYVLCEKNIVGYMK